MVGESLRVRPGEKVPVDGELIEGRVSIDESLVTGESMPVTKEIGAKVIAGSINMTGSFVMQAEKVGAETLLSRIVQMVAEAQRSRAPIQRMADLVSGWFVPVVIATALLAAVVWALVGPEPRLSKLMTLRSGGRDWTSLSSGSDSAISAAAFLPFALALSLPAAVSSARPTSGSGASSPASAAD